MEFNDFANSFNSLLNLHSSPSNSSSPVTSSSSKFSTQSATISSNSHTEVTALSNDSLITLYYKPIPIPFNLTDSTASTTTSTNDNELRIRDLTFGPFHSRLGTIPEAASIKRTISSSPEIIKLLKRFEFIALEFLNPPSSVELEDAGDRMQKYVARYPYILHYLILPASKWWNCLEGKFLWDEFEEGWESRSIESLDKSELEDHDTRALFAQLTSICLSSLGRWHEFSEKFIEHQRVQNAYTRWRWYLPVSLHSALIGGSFHFDREKNSPLSGDERESLSKYMLIHCDSETAYPMPSTWTLYSRKVLAIDGGLGSNFSESKSL